MKLGPVNIDGNAIATSVIATILAALILRAILKGESSNG